MGRKLEMGVSIVYICSRDPPSQVCIKDSKKSYLGCDFTKISLFRYFYTIGHYAKIFQKNELEVFFQFLIIFSSAVFDGRSSNSKILTVNFLEPLCKFYSTETR